MRDLTQNDDTVTLGMRLRVARKEHGLSGRHLAELVKVDPAQVTRWEQGAAMPTPHALIRLAQTLELPASELFALAGIPLPTDHAMIATMLRTEYHLPAEAVTEIETHIAELQSRYK
ncbi:helix-turn-helix domain-containing protein [Mycobacteroides abscessus]|uniref:helix-turn-helix domain-containing protein n=1 Tax=Mycobacteroides abscessus TaxID=36809 RepID=UPI00232A870A|nr:helix-turn-helix transcriptional regulator [Mycobacteroides abscessus]MDB2210875.1 helix-turn-helix transcriptional regulator [Mycobacteroides abscessus subsp. massiliense]MDB2233988.1 helix-turn-helix transcriptional regulator [Mycobacteroides abscessus subsp. massiliense]